MIAFAGRTHAQDPARFLSAQGYGVLLFDRRGEATSDGDPNAFGWEARGTSRRQSSSSATARHRPRADRWLGFSVGGELLEEAAGNDSLKAVVSEGAGIRSVREVTEDSGVEKWLGIPVWGVTTVGTALFSNSMPPPNLKDLVSDVSPTPVFLIHAERGQGGEHLSAEYHAVAVPGARMGHRQQARRRLRRGPRGYERRVTAFFDDALLGGRR